MIGKKLFHVINISLEASWIQNIIRLASSLVLSPPSVFSHSILCIKSLRKQQSSETNFLSIIIMNSWTCISLPRWQAILLFALIIRSSERGSPTKEFWQRGSPYSGVLTARKRCQPHDSCLRSLWWLACSGVTAAEIQFRCKFKPHSRSITKQSPVNFFSCQSRLFIIQSRHKKSLSHKAVELQQLSMSCVTTLPITFPFISQLLRWLINTSSNFLLNIRNLSSKTLPVEPPTAARPT